MSIGIWIIEARDSKVGPTRPSRIRALLTCFQYIAILQGKLKNGTEFDDYVQGMLGFMSSVCCSKKRDEFIKNWHNDAEGGKSGPSGPVTIRLLGIARHFLPFIDYLTVLTACTKCDFRRTNLQIFNTTQYQAMVRGQFHRSSAIRRTVPNCRAEPA